MFLELSQGTFLWNWATSWAPLHGMAISMIAATLAVFLTRWTPDQGLLPSSVSLRRYVGHYAFGFSEHGDSDPGKQ